MSCVLPTLNSYLILIQTGSISSAEESTSCNSGLLYWKCWRIYRENVAEDKFAMHGGW